jgi:uncharacterized DUF497 family protein
MKFEWDNNKNEVNIQQHGIAFHDVDLIFEHPMLIKPDTRKDYGKNA